MKNNFQGYPLLAAGSIIYSEDYERKADFSDALAGYCILLVQKESSGTNRKQQNSCFRYHTCRYVESNLGSGFFFN
jgi:hypothetical protein